jgi:hypothetical protein
VLINEVRGTGSSSRFLSAACVKTLSTQSTNPQITNALVFYILKPALWVWLSTLVGISEAIRLLLTTIFTEDTLLFELFLFSALISSPYRPLSVDEQAVRFNAWLGGLIDGDGRFLLSKKGYASLEVVTELRDQACLAQIKQVFGGAIQLRAGNKHLRYRLHNRSGLLKLVAAVSGHIRNPVRLSQLNKICVHYDLPLTFAHPLVYRDG